MSRELMYTVQELADALRVSYRHIRQMMVLGKLPAHRKLGLRSLFCREEIRAWIKAGCPARKDWEEMKKAQSA